LLAVRQLSPIDRHFESDSNAGVFKFHFESQENRRASSIEDGIEIDSEDPTTQTSEPASKSTKNAFRTLNETDPSSIPNEQISLTAKARSWIVVTDRKSIQRHSQKIDSTLHKEKTRRVRSWRVLIVVQASPT
jgi:hypothetical protein